MSGENTISAEAVDTLDNIDALAQSIGSLNLDLNKCDNIDYVLEQTKLASDVVESLSQFYKHVGGTETDRDSGKIVVLADSERESLIKVINFLKDQIIPFLEKCEVAPMGLDDPKKNRGAVIGLKNMVIHNLHVLQNWIIICELLVAGLPKLTTENEGVKSNYA